MMAGLELLYNSVVNSFTAPQDAMVCFVHWEIVKSGYKCLGIGDQAQQSDRKSELLPRGWNGSNELYTLRYQSRDGKSNLLLKAITVDNTLILDIMDTESEQVSDLTLNVRDYINEDGLSDFDRVYKKAQELSAKVLTGLLQRPSAQKVKGGEGQSKKAEDSLRDGTAERRPYRGVMPPRYPHTGRRPSWSDPLTPFSTGRADLDPFGEGTGGMIMDPLRSGFPRSGLDPSAGIPGNLPPGAVPPGARFDPFGPVGSNFPGPDPDHMPPPGYDNMFM